MIVGLYYKASYTSKNIVYANSSSSKISILSTNKKYNKFSLYKANYLQYSLFYFLDQPLCLVNPYMR